MIDPMIEVAGGRLKPVWLLGLVAALLASWYFPFVGLAVLVGVAATRLAGKISLTEKLLLLFLAGLTFNAFLYEIYNLLHIRPLIGWSGLIYVLLAAVISLRFGRQKAGGLINRRIVAAGITAIIVLAGLIYPVLANAKSAGGHTFSALATLKIGQDNSEHFAIFRYVYFHDSYTYNSTVAKTGLHQALINYPQGSDLTAAWLAKSLTAGRLNSNARLLDAYYVLLAASYAALAAVTVLLALMVFNQVRETQLHHAAVVVGLTLLLLAAGPVLALPSAGYLPQIVSYLYLLALVYVSLRTDITNFKIKIGLMTLLFGGIAISWWFLVPVATVPILVWLWQQRRGLLSELASSPLFDLGLGVLLLLCIYPAAISYLSASTPNLASTGGLYRIAPTTTAFYILLVVYWAAQDFIKTRLKNSVALVAVGLAAVVFTALMGLYQWLSFGYVAYYFTKSIYTIMLFGTLAAGLLALRLADQLVANDKRQRWLASLAVLVALVLSTASVNAKLAYGRPYLQKQTYRPAQRAQLHALFDAKTAHYQDLIYLGGCSSLVTHVNNLWSGSLFQANMDWHWDVDTAAHTGDSLALQSLIKGLPKPLRQSTYVYADKACLDDHLVSLVKAGGYPSNL